MFDILVESITFSAETITRLYTVVGGIGVVLAVILASVFVIRFSKMIIGRAGSDSSSKRGK